MTDEPAASHSYFAESSWPVECGGNTRSKLVKGKLCVQGLSPRVIHKNNARWNVMFIHRKPGELYLTGTLPAFKGPAPFGWVQKIDPFNMEVLEESPALACGGHVWCGSIAAHENGCLYNVNGRYLHSLNSRCQVISERELCVDQAHNGLLILSDGTIVTKDLRLDSCSTLTRLDPATLEDLHPPLKLPEPSMGRIASQIIGGTEYIYVPGQTKIFRVLVHADTLEIDQLWQPNYRELLGTGGMAWDTCISAGYIWLMDNGDIWTVRSIFSQDPNGRFVEDVPSLDWRDPAPWIGQQRLIRISIEDEQYTSISPFQASGGGIIAPPAFIPSKELCVCWDSINGGIAGVRSSKESLEVAWMRHDIRPTMQPLVYEETNHLVTNHFDGASDHLLVIDIDSGDIVCDVNIGSPLANGMFLTPGQNNDVLYCSTVSYARIVWD